MTTSKKILPVLMTVFLAGGAALATSAISAPAEKQGQKAAQSQTHQGDGAMMQDGMGRGGCPGMSGHGGMGGMGGHDGMGGYGHKGMNLSPEQREKMDALMQDANTRLQPLRDQLFVKREELRALQNASNPDVKAVNQKATEINTLRDQMRKERTALGEKIDKELGLKPGTHNFGGKHNGGHGAGHDGY